MRYDLTPIDPEWEDLPEAVMFHESGSLDWCVVHQHWEIVTEHGYSPGYTGAGISWTSYACGAQEVDASADSLEAAR